MVRKLQVTACIVIITDGWVILQPGADAERGIQPYIVGAVICGVDVPPERVQECVLQVTIGCIIITDLGEPDFVKGERGVFPHVSSAVNRGDIPGQCRNRCNEQQRYEQQNRNDQTMPSRNHMRHVSRTSNETRGGALILFSAGLWCAPAQKSLHAPIRFSLAGGGIRVGKGLVLRFATLIIFPEIRLVRKEPGGREDFFRNLRTKPGSARRIFYPGKWGNFYYLVM